MPPGKMGLLGVGYGCSTNIEEVHHILVTADDRIVVHRRIKMSPRRVPIRKRFLVAGGVTLNR